MTASIVLSKCSKHNKTFGVRIEKREKDWIRTWAFPVDESRGKREGYDKTKIIGSLNPSPEFPGCPHCGTSGLVICGYCNKMSCYDGVSNSVFCHWCSKLIAELEEGESFDVKSGGF